MTDRTEAQPLPSGLVTFLLSDVVGSTRLWEGVPHLMPDALARHEQLILHAVEQHDGVLLKSKGEGDSTFSVFARPADAARAALVAQRALRDEAWTPDCRITVRMALHTGEAVERDRDYFGRAVNRAARLRGVADGGEVLATLTTAELITQDLPTGALLVELGVEQLRDLDRPETVFLLTDHDRPSARLRSSAHPIRSLPLPVRLRAGAQQPFAGRKAELHQLEQAWARSATGQPGLLLINGEAGIGKTRLASELAVAVHEHGGIVLAGHCDDLSGAPFQPFTEAFRFVAERVPFDSLPAVTPSQMQVLGRLAPDLVNTADPQRARDVGLERERLVAAMSSWFRAISVEAPVLFVLEDLHWATETTIEMLRALLRESAAERLLVVATSRPMTQADAAPRLLLEEAHQLASSFEQIDLTGLSAAETRQLLEGTERAVEPVDAGEVHALTNGNPLFALAISSSIVDRSGPSTVGGATLELPGSVHAILGRQLAQLDDASLTFLQAAAILGSTFEVDVAAALADAPFDVVEDALDAGERHLIVREHSAGALHLYDFHHALVASALTGQLTAIRRRRLHAGAARLVASAAMVDGDRISRVAHHAAQAGNALLPLESIAAFREAAWHARDRMAIHEAIRWLELARALLDAVDDNRLRIQIDIELGSASFAAGSPEAREQLRAAAEGALRLGDSELLVAALVAADWGGASEYLRVDERRIALLEAALNLLPPGDKANRARLLVMLALEFVYADDREGHRFALADEALVIARELDDPAVLDIVLDHRLSLFTGPAYVEQRLEETGAQLDLLERERVPAHRRFTFLASRTRVFQQLGRVEEGRACLDEMRAIATSEPLLPRHELFFEMIVAGWELLGGRLAAAEASVRAAFRLVKATGDNSLGAATARQMLGIRFWQDRIDTLLESVAFGVTINPLLRAHHAYWLLQDGRVDEAAQVWALWEDDPVDALLDGGTGESMVLEAAAVCAAFEGADRCRYYYSLLEPYGDRIVNPFAPDQPTYHYLGLLAHALNDVDLAVAQFEASIDFAHRVEAPLMAGRSSLELARILAAHDRDRSRAVDLARSAATAGVDLEAVWLVRNGNDLLETIGGR